MRTWSNAMRRITMPRNWSMDAILFFVFMCVHRLSWICNGTYSMDILFVYPTREGFTDLKIFATGKYLVPPVKINFASVKPDFDAGKRLSQRYRVGNGLHLAPLQK